jgi:4-amino-4-deoxy-L-arabinose transferase-like glycosyltransferase
MEEMPRKIPRLLWLAVPLAYLLYFYHLGAVGMIPPDEPRYASIGREMARSGDWITPRLWGETWFEKPALLYWMIGGAFRLGLGPDLSPRVPVASTAVAFLVFFWWFARREFGSRAAWFAALILATCGEWLAFSQVGVTDLPITAAFAAAMLLALPWVARGDGRFLPAAGALLGVAVLAKGLVPLALAAPLAPVAWWACRARGTARGTDDRFSSSVTQPARGTDDRFSSSVAQPARGTDDRFSSSVAQPARGTDDRFSSSVAQPARGTDDRFSSSVAFRAGIPFLIVSIPWYLLCFLRNGPVFLKQFFVVHHFARITSGALMHRQPWWFYLPVFAAAFLPWTPLLFLRPRRGAWRDPRRVLLAAWVLFGLLLFSVAVNKLPGYVLPLLPAAALLAGVALDEAEAAGARLWLAACALLLVAFPMAAPMLAATLESGLSKAPRPAFQWIWLAPAAIAAAAWAWESRGRRLAAVVSIAIGAAAGVFYLKQVALPQVEQMVAARTLWRRISPHAGEVCIDRIERDWRYGLNYYSITPLPECAAQPKALRVIQNPEQPPRLAPAPKPPVDLVSPSVVTSPFRN